MRRRQRFEAAQTIKIPIPKGHVPLASNFLRSVNPVLTPETKLITVPKKGVCEKCSTYIGKGVHFHRKHCKG